MTKGPENRKEHSKTLWVQLKGNNRAEFLLEIRKKYALRVTFLFRLL
jgi:hypothetical protein